MDFPIDVLFTPVEVDSVAWGSITAPPVSLPAPDAGAVEQAMRLWGEAERPVILVSTGAARAADEVEKLAEATNTPIFHSPKFSTTIKRSHPLFGGVATRLPILRTQGPAPDFVLLLGARTGFLIGGRSGAIVPNESEAKVVQVDLDGSEIGRSRKIDVRDFPRSIYGFRGGGPVMLTRINTGRYRIRCWARSSGSDSCGIQVVREGHK